MSLNIYTPVASINAQRNLTITTSQLNKTLASISSGLRINKSADGAAELGVATSFQIQMNGMQQNMRNVTDGVSLLGTAEASISEVTTMLERINVLANQASNATYTDADRVVMQKEVTALVSEIDRVSQTANFNGMNLLDGTFQGKFLQVGPNATTADTISIGFSSFSSGSLGQVNMTASKATAAYTSTQVKFTTPDGVAHQTATFTASADAAAKAVNDLQVSGVTASVTNVAKLTLATTAPTGPTTFKAGTTMTYNGKTYTLFGSDASFADKAAGLQGLADAITKAGAGMTAFTDGSDVYINSDNALAASAITFNTTATTSSFGAITQATASFADLQIQSSQALTAVSGVSLVTGTATTQVQGGVNTSDVTTVASAQKTMKVTSDALKQVIGYRADIGALENRLQSTYKTLLASNEAAAASFSGMMDTDYAYAASEMARLQVIQQAGISALAQANQLPQAALSLLR